MPPPAFFLLGAVTSPRSRGARAAAAVASHRTSTWLPSSLQASSSAFAKSCFSTTSTTSLSPSSPHKPPGPLPPLGGLKPPLPPPKQPASPPGAFPFVPCGEGFTSATATPGNSSPFSVYSSWGWGHESLKNGGSSRAAISRRGEEEGDKEEDDHARPLEPGRKSRIVALADCGHGVGRALLAALLEYPHTPSIVAAATTSEELTSSLRFKHWAECEALQLDVACVNLGNDNEVKDWAGRTEFTHGVPDIVITNCGGLPTYWKTNYDGPDNYDPRDEAVVGGYARPYDGRGGGEDFRDAKRAARLWETRAIDWARLMNDVKGVSNVLRRFLPAMVQPTAVKSSRSTGGFTLCVARHYAWVARGSGTVINITHVLDPPSGADVSAYQASRAAVSALTRRLAGELPSPMTAVELDPGELLGLMTETEGADVGPLHKAGGDEAASNNWPTDPTSQDWAHAAVPFILGLTHEVSGSSVHVPGFGGLAGGGRRHRVPE